MKPPTQWTDPMLAELKLRRERGETIPAIGIAMRLTEEIVRNKCHKMKFRTPKYIPLDRETLRTHYDNGIGFPQIATMMRVSHDKVAKAVKRYNFPPRPQPEPMRDDAWTDAEKAVLIEAGYTKTSAELMKLLPGRTDIGIRIQRANLRTSGVALPMKEKRPAPVKKPSPAWTEAEKAIVIEAGYFLKIQALMPLLPGRSYGAIERTRTALMKEKKIARPMRQPAKEKPAREAKAPRVRKAKVVAPKPVKAAHARKVVEPVPAAPTTELQPGQERLLRYPWDVIKQIGLRHGVIMTEMHDLGRLNKRRESLGLPLVFFSGMQRT